MSDPNYTIKISRSDGIVEIAGPDKDWVADQLDKVTAVFSEPSPVSSVPKPKDDAKTEPSKLADSETKPRVKRSGGDRAKRKPALEAKLTSEIKSELQTYVDARPDHWKLQVDQVGVIATFLLDKLGWDAIDEDDIYTVYVTMGWPTPGKPRSTLDNARHRKGYFGPWSGGKLQLSHKGENFGRALPAAGDSSQ